MPMSARRTVVAAAAVVVTTSAAVGARVTSEGATPAGGADAVTRVAGALPGATASAAPTAGTGLSTRIGTPGPAASSTTGGSTGGDRAGGGAATTTGTGDGGASSESAPDGGPATSHPPRGKHDGPLLTAVPAGLISATDELVGDYPGLLGPAPHSRVLSSSMSPAGSRVQVALVARTARSLDAVLRYYRTRLAHHGFAERPVSAVGGASAAAFERRDSTVVVTAGAGQAGGYTVYATLTVG